MQVACCNNNNSNNGNNNNDNDNGNGDGDSDGIFLILIEALFSIDGYLIDSEKFLWRLYLLSILTLCRFPGFRCFFIPKPQILSHVGNGAAWPYVIWYIYIHECALDMR